MALQVPVTINHPGYDFTANAVAADGASGDTWVNTGAQMVLINNGSVSSVTVTLSYQITFDGATLTNKTFVIPAGHVAIIGPFNQAYYNNPVNQQAKITYSSATSVTILVFQPGT